LGSALRKLSEYHADTQPLQITFYYPEMGNVAGQAVNIIDQDRVKQLFRRIISQAVEFGPCQKASAPALITIRANPNPAIFCGKSLQFIHLGIDCLALPLFLGRNPAVQGHA